MEALTPPAQWMARYRWLARQGPAAGQRRSGGHVHQAGGVSETQVAVPLRRRNSHAAPPVMVCPAERLTT